MQLSSIGSLPSRPIAWLWPGRLALGKLAILDGDPGLGKSLVTLDLCARLSTGRPFPDGAAAPEAAASLVINGEDSIDDTLRARLETLGADLERVFVLYPGDEPGAETLRLPEHLAVLDDALTRTQARLLVIDPIVAFLDPRLHTGNDASIRRALTPLAQLAQRRNTAVLMVRHLNKSPGLSPLYRGGGSIGILAACRSGWLIARNPEQPAQCVLAQVKNNLAPPQPSLAYEIRSVKGVPLSLSWLGATDWAAAQLLSGTPRHPPKPLSPRELACAFLDDMLCEGPRTSREIWPEALRRGLTERTLERAKQELQVRSVRVWADGQRLSYWLLPGQDLPEEVEHFVIDPDYWLSRDGPPPTPIDGL
jgi:putative DNA primase/helicase